MKIAVAAAAVAGFVLPFAPLLALATFVAWRIVGRRRRSALPSAAADGGGAPAARPAIS